MNVLREPPPVLQPCPPPTLPEGVKRPIVQAGPMVVVNPSGRRPWRQSEGRRGQVRPRQPLFPNACRGPPEAKPHEGGEADVRGRVPLVLRVIATYLRDDLSGILGTGGGTAIVLRALAPDTDDRGTVRRGTHHFLREECISKDHDKKGRKRRDSRMN